MTEADLPVYLVALGDSWLKAQGDDAALAFGNRTEAQLAVRKWARTLDKPPALFRIVKYVLAEVFEG